MSSPLSDAQVLELYADHVCSLAGYTAGQYPDIVADTRKVLAFKTDAETVAWCAAHWDEPESSASANALALRRAAGIPADAMLARGTPGSQEPKRKAGRQVLCRVHSGFVILESTGTCWSGGFMMVDPWQSWDVIEWWPLPALQETGREG